jgi:Ca2+-binding EF-hand superfamily protein
MVCLLENMAGGHTATNEKGGEKSGSLLDSSLPAWTRIDLEQYLGKRRPLLARWCLPSKMTITRQDSMYWMERKGPKLYLILFQIQMVFTASYVSLLILSSFPFMINSSEVSDFEQWGYVAISLLPVFLLFSKYHTAAANLTMACSIGVHRRPQAVSQVIREGKTDRIIRALVIMQKLERAATDGSFAVPVESPASGRWPLSVTAEELEEVTTTFDTLDLSGDGCIRSTELGQVLVSLGAKATEESLTAMVAVLDKDKDGNISRDEFLDFYQKHMVFDLDHEGLHELARHMFEQFDSDGNGVITLSEFKNVMDALNVDFSIDEIGELVNELDEQHAGTIAEHQFVELLKKHDHLFEQIKLPKLE